MAIQVGFASDLNINVEEINNFYQTHWKRKIALGDKRFYEWQFILPPANLFRDSCVIAIKGRTILGVMGLNRRSFKISGKILKGAELTTWVVDETNKGGGAGAKILRYIMDEFDFLIGMGITQDALPIYLRSGFRFLNAIPRFIRVMELDKMISLSIHEDYAKKVLRRQNISSQDYDYKKTIWREEKSPPMVNGHHFSRELQDLIWRYDQHPYYDYFTYKIYIPNTPKRYVYVVLRHEITKDVRMLHVLDILGYEQGYEIAINFVEKYAIDNNFWAIDCYSTLSNLNKYFYKLGWLSAVDDIYINVPHLFHPLEVRTPPTTSLIFWSKEKSAEFFDTSNFYITKQDADLDRPTMDFIRAL